MTGKTWLAIALAVSLLLNALALGAGIRLWHLKQELTGANAATLPRATQRQLVVAMAHHRETLAPLLHAVQDARAEAVAAAEAQPFDRAKTETAMGDLRKAVDDLMLAAQGIALDSLAGN
jgi:hypothetical protein